MLLRLFAKRETLAMLYHNIKTEVTIFPNLRPGPESQHQDILNEFWGFYSDARWFLLTSAKLSLPGITEFSIIKDSYRFYAKFFLLTRSEGIHRIYLLLANESLTTGPTQVASEILRNLRSQIEH